LFSVTAERNRCNSQATRNNYRGYLHVHVLKYLLFITITLKQKGVMQTHIRLQVFKRDIFAFTVRLLQAYSSASLLFPLV